MKLSKISKRRGKQAAARNRNQSAASTGGRKTVKDANSPLRNIDEAAIIGALRTANRPLSMTELVGRL